MTLLKKYFIPVLFAAALLSAAGAASAMDISQYQALPPDSQTGYVAALLQGSAAYLNANHQTGQAEKMTALFADTSSNGGIQQLAKNIQSIQTIDKNTAALPNNKRKPYGVEHAVFITLKNNGIIVPITVLQSVDKTANPLTPPAAAAPPSPVKP